VGLALDDLIAVKLKDDNIGMVFDYIFENYKTPNSRIPPKMLATCSYYYFFLTKNGYEPLLSKFNCKFSTVQLNIL